MPFVRTRNWLIVVLALLAGGALRLWFIHKLPEISGDSLIYGDIAKNWLLHGIYGISDGASATPTLIRLPGYPLFLLLCFRIFGLEHYKAVMFAQATIDLGSCVLVAAFVRRIATPGAALIAIWLAAICPFTANYVASPLAETLSVFCLALAFCAIAEFYHRPHWLPLALLTFAFSYGALLRPDGALIAVVLWPAVLLAPRKGLLTFPQAFRAALICGLIAVLPFAIWTWRNARTFGVFQPLAPRYATDPGDNPGAGFQRWVKTWCVDFVSTLEIYWNFPGDILHIEPLPARAFDYPAQREKTEEIFRLYNKTMTVTPDVDARFAALAEERIHAHPFRYYVELPSARLANMWFRPRVESLPIDYRWWEYSKHHRETEFSLAYGALNLAYIIAALVGIFRRPPFVWAMVGYLVLRSALLLTIEAPETRYTIECFPIIFALASIALARPIYEQSESRELS
jgi:hypothetical protein